MRICRSTPFQMRLRLLSGCNCHDRRTKAIPNQQQARSNANPWTTLLLRCPAPKVQLLPKRAPARVAVVLEPAKAACIHLRRSMLQPSWRGPFLLGSHCTRPGDSWAPWMMASRRSCSMPTTRLWFLPRNLSVLSSRSGDS